MIKVPTKPKRKSVAINLEFEGATRGKGGRYEDVKMDVWPHKKG